MLMSRVLLIVTILSLFQLFASVINMAQDNFMPSPLLFRNFQISQMAISFIEISHKSSTNFQKNSQSFTLKRITFSSKIIIQSNCIQVGNRKLTELRAEAWIVEFTTILRTSKYSNISWYVHFTLVHILGDTSTQTVVGDSILKEKFGFNPVPKFTDLSNGNKFHCNVISHKISTNFQKVSQSFTLKRITFSSKIIMQSNCIPVGYKMLTKLRAYLDSGVYHHLPYF